MIDDFNRLKQKLVSTHCNNSKINLINYLRFKRKSFLFCIKKKIFVLYRVNLIIPSFNVSDYPQQ